MALLIDDAELLDPRLLERLIFTVLDRLHSNVLAVVTTTPGAPVLARFNPAQRYGPRWERIGSLDVDPTMDESARRRLIETTTTGWSASTVDRLAARSRSFSDVWAVLRLPAACDIPHAVGSNEQLRLINDLTNQVIHPGVPPPSARALAWVGGLMHEMQLTAAVAALLGERVLSRGLTDDAALPCRSCSALCAFSLPGVRRALRLGTVQSRALRHCRRREKDRPGGL